MNPDYHASKFFVFTMWYRIFYGIVRLIVAALLLNVIGLPLGEVVRSVVPMNWVDAPSDLLSRVFEYIFAGHQVQISYFLTVYLSFWGLVDIILSLCILRGKIWAYPISMVLIVLFVAYELYRLTYTHSSILMFFIGVDIFVFWLIWREYKKLKA